MPPPLLPLFAAASTSQLAVLQLTREQQGRLAAATVANISTAQKVATATVVPFGEAVLVHHRNQDLSANMSPFLTVVTFDSVASGATSPVDIADGAYAMSASFCRLNSPTLRYSMIVSNSDARAAATMTQLNANTVFTPGADLMAVLQSASSGDAGMFGAQSYNSGEHEMDDGARGFAFPVWHTNASYAGLYMRVCTIATRSAWKPVLGRRLTQARIINYIIFNKLIYFFKSL